MPVEAVTAKNTLLLADAEENLRPLVHVRLEDPSYANVDSVEELLKGSR